MNDGLGEGVVRPPQDLEFGIGSLQKPDWATPHRRSRRFDRVGRASPLSAVVFEPGPGIVGPIPEIDRASVCERGGSLYEPPDSQEEGVNEPIEADRPERASTRADLARVVKPLLDVPVRDLLFRRLLLCPRITSRVFPVEGRPWSPPYRSGRWGNALLRSVTGVLERDRVGSGEPPPHAYWNLVIRERTTRSRFDKDPSSASTEALVQRPQRSRESAWRPSRWTRRTVTSTRAPERSERRAEKARAAPTADHAPL